VFGRDGAGELGQRDRTGDHVLDPEAGGELRATGGELDDAVATRVGEALDGGVDGLRRGAVDGREGVRVFLGASQHLGVDLGGCEGHELPPDGSFYPTTDSRSAAS